MNTLYDITQQQRFTLLEIEELAGELTPELEERLEITATQLSGKSMAYLEVITSKESFNTMVDAEIKRLQQLKKVNNNLITRLKDNLLHAVKTFGPFEVGTHKFGTRKSSTIEVDDINSLPKEFKVTTITERADKAALKKAIKGGEEIDGVELVEHLNLKIS